MREMPGQHNASKKLHAQFFLDQVPTVVITSSKFLIQRQREEEQKQIHEKIRKSLQLNNNNNDDDDNNKEAGGPAMGQNFEKIKFFNSGPRRVGRVKRTFLGHLKNGGHPLDPKRVM